MNTARPRTYVGFGFGAIQAGLFLAEAHQSGAFGRLVVAEVAPDTVRAVRAAGGRYAVNIAHADRIERAEVGPVEILDPADPADRERLVDAIAVAQEVGTAVPGVANYGDAGAASVCAVLAAGLRRKAAGGGPRAVVYAAENHNHAAEILEAAVMGELPAGERAAAGARVRFLNTVIGKMSGVVADGDAPAGGQLAMMVPGAPRGFLVEEFNRILVSQVRFGETPGQPPFQRGIAVFVERPDLLPFEEAKLYGHNATHALAAYLGFAIGARTIADLASVPGVMAFLRAAFIGESGSALVAKHAGVDPLFTPAGYSAYADDLLVRMVNPNLGDTIERVGRDPARKLAWSDRLIGTMRVALAMGVTPERYAFGAAAALARLTKGPAAAADVPAILAALWADAPASAERAAVVALVAEAAGRFARWAAAGHPDLEAFWAFGPAHGELAADAAWIAARHRTTDAR